MTDEPVAANSPRFTAELLSLFDPRYLAHQTRSLDEIEAERVRRADEPTIRAIEIGCERGDFLVGVAQTWAPSPVLGLEWRQAYARSANERMTTLGMPQATVLAMDAKLAIPLLIPPATLDAVFVTFPDPWWKKRHADRRVLEPIFMRVLARRLRPGGRLYLKSDVFDYLYRVRAFAQVCDAFRPLQPERWPDESTWTLTTRERKCMRSAIPFGRGYYEVREDFDRTMPAEPEDGARFAVEEEVDATRIIKGAPPIDRDARTRQRQLQSDATPAAAHDDE